MRDNVTPFRARLKVASSTQPALSRHKVDTTGGDDGGNMDNNERIAILENNIHHIDKSLNGISLSIENINRKLECLPEINSSINNLKETVASTQKKVDDLVKWKHMIFGAAALIGFAGGILTIFRYLN